MVPGSSNKTAITKGTTDTNLNILLEHDYFFQYWFRPPCSQGFFFSWYNKITLNGKKNSCRKLFWWKKILANSDTEKKKFYSEEIAQVPPLKLNGPSPMRMEAHDLVYLQEFFHQNKSLQESLCSEWCHNKTWSSDFTHSFRRLAKVSRSCIALGTWADYHLIDNELNQFPVWPNHALPSALGTDHLILVEGLGQFLLSMNFFFSASLFARIFFHQNNSRQEFSKSILKEIIMFQKYV